MSTVETFDPTITTNNSEIYNVRPPISQIISPKRLERKTIQKLASKFQNLYSEIKCCKNDDSTKKRLNPTIKQPKQSRLFEASKIGI